LPFIPFTGRIFAQVEKHLGQPKLPPSLNELLNNWHLLQDSSPGRVSTVYEVRCAGHEQVSRLFVLLKQHGHDLA
jgi:hypothetical protein